MQKLAFKMKLLPGKADEYQKRHDEIWPELVDLLHDHGISDYSIFLDETNLDLIGVLKIIDPTEQNKLPHHAIMKKWWVYMADIMETNADSSPKSLPIREVFHME